MRDVGEGLSPRAGKPWGTGIQAWATQAASARSNEEHTRKCWGNHSRPMSKLWSCVPQATAPVLSVISLTLEIILNARICTQIFTADFLLIAPNWKLPSNLRWVNCWTVIYPYHDLYYSESHIRYTTWKNFQEIMLREEKSQYYLEIQYVVPSM